MLKFIAGVLIGVTISITSMAYPTGPESVVVKETPTLFSNDSFAPWEDKSKKDQKAESLVVITTTGCKPCRRLKVATLVPMIFDGYDITIIQTEDWEYPAVKDYPTLFYMDGKSNILRVEIGFKTVEHIEKYLTK